MKNFITVGDYTLAIADITRLEIRTHGENMWALIVYLKDIKDVMSLPWVTFDKKEDAEKQRDKILHYLNGGN